MARAGPISLSAPGIRLEGRGQGVQSLAGPFAAGIEGDRALAVAYFSLEPCEDLVLSDGDGRLAGAERRVDRQRDLLAGRVALLGRGEDEEVGLQIVDRGLRDAGVHAHRGRCLRQRVGQGEDVTARSEVTHHVVELDISRASAERADSRSASREVERGCRNLFARMRGYVLPDPVDILPGLHVVLALDLHLQLAPEIHPPAASSGAMSRPRR